MTDEQRPDIQLGTGSPRSELDATTAQPLTPPDPSDLAADTTDEPTPNRSGSGGSGGPVNEPADPQEEGSTGQSMDELLGTDRPT